MVFVSACLIGCKCRYNGKHALVQGLKDSYEQGLLFPVCPEVIAGFPIPRDPIDIDGESGEQVLLGNAKVLTKSGQDITDSLLKSSGICVKISKMLNIKSAILKDRSPSCGVFSTSTVNGFTDSSGVIAAALKKSGIKLFTENCDLSKVPYES